MFLSIAALVACAPSALHAQATRGLTTPAAQYFMNRQVNAAADAHASIQMLNPRPVREPQQVGGSKPFDHIQRPPTLSPYLGLDAVPEGATSLPNWHTFVQPQLQQRNSAESRARELIRTRQQMRVATARYLVPENPPASTPITGSGTQFLNVGGYFPGLR